jgi:hypothetical protein
MNNPTAPSFVSPLRIQELGRLASRGLVSMFDPETNRFCQRVVRAQPGYAMQGISPRYTIMTLLGLREFEKAGQILPLDAHGIYRSFVRDSKWIENGGDLGLMIWLVSEYAPDYLGDALSKFDVHAAPNRFLDLRDGRTTELAWFLAGLTHAALASPALSGRLTDLAVNVHQLLKKNQGESGFFGHMDRARSVAGVLRGRVGSFADQVYPIYAMSKFASTFNVGDAARDSDACASAICDAQGELGQWCWLYDSRSGRVSSRYPVYSVHQHGMAPMALYALAEATGRNFDEPIHKGLRWIFGENELNQDMREPTKGLIWRCILPKSSRTKYWNTAVSLIGQPNQNLKKESLGILFEERPYESGWLLYAFSRFMDA